MGQRRRREREGEECVRTGALGRERNEDRDLSEGVDLPERELLEEFLYFLAGGVE